MSNVKPLDKSNVFNDIGRKTFEEILLNQEIALKLTESTQERLNRSLDCSGSHYEVYGFKT
jgi:hypothetical protein